jgi:hypothetical protein
MNEIVLKLPKDTISYDQYRTWCIKMGRLDGWNYDYCSDSPANKATWYLISTKLPEDLAILFRLEFNV